MSDPVEVAFRSFNVRIRGSVPYPSDEGDPGFVFGLWLSAAVDDKTCLCGFDPLENL